jgi:hypothetical protein
MDVLALQPAGTLGVFAFSLFGPGGGGIPYLLNQTRGAFIWWARKR